MKIGIIGPPQSGKTSIFKILLQSDIPGNIGVFKVLDLRIKKISDISCSSKATYPEITFIDIGNIRELTKKELSKLHDIDLFICVSGVFFSEGPKKEMESILTDIILFDLEVVQGRIGRLEKEKIAVDTGNELKALKKCEAFLSAGKLLWKAGLNKDDVRPLSGLVFLSDKPLILVMNISEEDGDVLENRIKPLEEYCHSEDIHYIKVFGKTELELLELRQEERKEFLVELGAGYNFREELSKLISIELNLATFFTTGEKETKGWLLSSGLSVLEAAGKIHSDIKRGFIRAEVVHYEDFIKYGSIHKAREAGVLKVEGKEYIVKDGDIVNVRFSA